MNEPMPFDYRSLRPNTFDYRACLECDRGNVCRSPCFNIEPRNATTPPCCNQQPYYAPNPPMCLDSTRCHQITSQGPPHMTPPMQAQLSPPMSPQMSVQQPHQQYTQHNQQHQQQYQPHQQPQQYQQPPQQYTQHHQQQPQHRKTPTQRKEPKKAGTPKTHPAKECKKYGRNHPPTVPPVPNHIAIPVKEVPSVITLYKKKSILNASSSLHCGIVEDFLPVPKEKEELNRKPTGTTATQYLLPDQISPEVLGPQIFQEVMRQLQYCNHLEIGNFLKKNPPHTQQPNGMCQNPPCCNCPCYNNCMCYQQPMHSSPPSPPPPTNNTWNMGHY